MPRDYKEAYSIEGVFGTHRFGMKILIDMERDFTATDNDNIRECVDSLQSLLMEETYKLDPKSQEEAAKERQEVINLFKDHAIFVEEIPNGYCSSYCCKHLPWFVVTTKRGRIKIGWRKRVISIDWEGSTIKHTAEEIFKEENVTKYDKLIHAYGYEKANEYINKLLA